MKNHLTRMFTLTALTLLALPGIAHADANVFACEPEWAALAKEIGGDKVNVTTATTALQDAHQVRARPSLIAAIRKADLVVCSGAGLEIGWLPSLLQKAGSDKIQPGQPGFMNAADSVPLLEKPAVLDRANGDVHPEGNPHIQTDPRNIARVAPDLERHLAAIDPVNATYYASRLSEFDKRWQAAMVKWNAEAKGLRGMPYISHHRNWSYLANWLGLVEMATLEPKPGIPPTTSHLQGLLATVRSRPVKVIMRTPFEPADAAQWLSDKSGIPVVILPYTVGGDASSGDLFGLYEQTLHLLLEANKGSHHASVQ
jgi:zinc/manganese transport system substrate-binding protein